MYIMLNRISKLMVNEPDGALQGALRYPSRNISVFVRFNDN